MAIGQSHQKVLSFSRASNRFKVRNLIIENPLSLKLTQQIVHLHLVVFGEEHVRVQDFHTIAFEFSCYFSVRAVLQALFRSDVNQQALVLEHRQLVFEQ